MKHKFNALSIAAILVLCAVAMQPSSKSTQGDAPAAEAPPPLAGRAIDREHDLDLVFTASLAMHCAHQEISSPALVKSTDPTSAQLGEAMKSKAVAPQISESADTISSSAGLGKITQQLPGQTLSPVPAVPVSPNLMERQSPANPVDLAGRTLLRW